MYSWEFASRKEHSPTWYMVAIVTILSLVGYGITQGLYLMSVASFLLAGVYMLIENNSLPTTQVVVDENGIIVGPTRYDYTSLAKFAILSVGGAPTYLRISEKKKISTTIDIPLTQDVNPLELKNFLSSYLEEDTHASFSNSDAIIHAMRL